MHDHAGRVEHPPQRRARRRLRPRPRPRAQIDLVARAGRAAPRAARPAPPAPPRPPAPAARRPARPARPPAAGRAACSPHPDLHGLRVAERERVRRLPAGCGPASRRRAAAPRRGSDTSSRRSRSRPRPQRRQRRVDRVARGESAGGPGARSTRSRGRFDRPPQRVSDEPRVGGAMKTDDFESSAAAEPCWVRPSLDAGMPAGVLHVDVVWVASACACAAPIRKTAGRRPRGNAASARRLAAPSRTRTRLPGCPSLSPVRVRTDARECLPGPNAQKNRMEPQNRNEIHRPSNALIARGPDDLRVAERERYAASARTRARARTRRAGAR